MSAPPSRHAQPARSSVLGPLLGLSLAALTGCGATAGSLRAPPDAPNFRVDVAASEVKLINGTNAAEVRDIGAKALDSMVLGVGQTQPARFSAIVTTEAAADYPGIFLCAIPFSPAIFPPLLCPKGDVEVTVELEVEIGGRTFKGVGDDGFSFSGLGTEVPDRDTQDWRAIVHNAFQEAMLDAFHKGAENGPKKTALK